MLEESSLRLNTVSYCIIGILYMYLSGCVLYAYYIYVCSSQLDVLYTCTYICAFSPLAYDTPENCCLLYLYVKLLQDSLNEYAYAAEIAGIEYKIFNSIYGLEVGRWCVVLVCALYCVCVCVHCIVCVCVCALYCGCVHCIVGMCTVLWVCIL